MQRALVGQWTQQYAATQGQTMSKKSDISGAVNMAREQLNRMGRPAPPSGWSGYDKAVDWKDIKAVLVQNEGADTHDFNIWDDRTNSLLRKPYIYGAVEGLTSRRMPTHQNALSKGFSEEMLISQGISHETNMSFTMNNEVNYAAWERSQYNTLIERIKGN